jgi:N-acetylneuraminate synthase/sialic acid synthase
MLGARVIEKHFTLNHAAKGTDHAFSLMPEGMRKLVRDLQRVPGALGDGVKRPLDIEEAPIRKMGKKLVAARSLEEGHVLTVQDIAIKSPADGGLPPYELERLVGQRLRRQLSPDANIELADLEPVEQPVAAHAAPRP